MKSPTDIAVGFDPLTSKAASRQNLYLQHGKYRCNSSFTGVPESLALYTNRCEVVMHPDVSRSIRATNQSG